MFIYNVVSVIGLLINGLCPYLGLLKSSWQLLLADRIQQENPKEGQRHFNNKPCWRCADKYENATRKWFYICLNETIKIRNGYNITYKIVWPPLTYDQQSTGASFEDSIEQNIGKGWWITETSCSWISWTKRPLEKNLRKNRESNLEILDNKITALQLSVIVLFIKFTGLNNTWITENHSNGMLQWHPLPQVRTC